MVASLREPDFDYIDVGDNYDVEKFEVLVTEFEHNKFAVGTNEMILPSTS